MSYNFTGTTGAGAVYGSFTYETVQAPLATDVRGLLGNATYQVTSWNMTAESAFPEYIQTTNYSNANGSVEFCQGKCIFGSGPTWYTTLSFQANNTLLQLAFDLADPTALTSPPQAHEWGAYNLQASAFRVMPIGAWALATSGSLSSVPEPGTWMLIVIGLLFGLVVHYASCSIGRIHA